MKVELSISPLIIFIPTKLQLLLIKLELMISTFKLVNNAPPASPNLLLVKLQIYNLKISSKYIFPTIFAELLIKLQLIKFMKLPGEVLSK